MVWLAIGLIVLSVAWTLAFALACGWAAAQGVALGKRDFK